MLPWGDVASWAVAPAGVGHDLSVRWAGRHEYRMSVPDGVESDVERLLADRVGPGTPGAAALPGGPVEGNDPDGEDAPTP